MTPSLHTPALDPAILAAQLSECARLEYLIKNIRLAAKARLADGVQIPGWKLIACNNSTVAEPAEALRRLRERWGDTTANAATKVIIDRAADALRLTQAMTYRDARGRIEETLDGLILRETIQRLVREKK